MNKTWKSCSQRDIHQEERSTTEGVQMMFLEAINAHTLNVKSSMAPKVPLIFILRSSMEEETKLTEKR